MSDRILSYDTCIASDRACPLCRANSVFDASPADRRGQARGAPGPWPVPESERPEPRDTVSFLARNPLSLTLV